MHNSHPLYAFVDARCGLSVARGDHDKEATVDFCVAIKFDSIIYIAQCTLTSQSNMHLAVEF